MVLNVNTTLQILPRPGLPSPHSLQAPPACVSLKSHSQLLLKRPVLSMKEGWDSQPPGTPAVQGRPP
ncbi:unnamed protein product [Gadus morhua 'NCC']